MVGAPASASQPMLPDAPVRKDIGRGSADYRSARCLRAFIFLTCQLSWSLSFNLTLHMTIANGINQCKALSTVLLFASKKYRSLGTGLVKKFIVHTFQASYSKSINVTKGYTMGDNDNQPAQPQQPNNEPNQPQKDGSDQEQE